MIKRIISAVACVLVCVAAMGADKPINALCLKMKPGVYHDDAISAQFVTNPEISYSNNGETLILSGKEGAAEFPIVNIVEMVFIHSEHIITEIADILNEQFPAANKAVEGIFDLNGVKHESITSPGIYIVNGKKVLVR